MHHQVDDQCCHGSLAGRHLVLRGKIEGVADYIKETMPNSRERSLALTKLEECLHWANAATTAGGRRSIA